MSSSTTFRFFGGIDFSGAKEPLPNLWTAVGEPIGERLRILSVRPHAYRADLAGYVAGGWRSVAPEAGEESAILWGADFPLGLPEEVARTLGAGTSWAKQIAWVADRPADEIRNAAGDAARLPRLTDAGGALAPLDLRLYKQTTEGLRWVHEMKDAADDAVSILPHHPAEGAATALIEVYPSATVRDLGLPRRRVPGRPGELRARVAALKPYLEFASPDCEVTAVTLEDAWDATIACLTAFLCRGDLEQPLRLNPMQQNRVRVEGWIYRPPAALAEPNLVAGRAR